MKRQQNEKEEMLIAAGTDNIADTAARIDRFDEEARKRADRLMNKLVDLQGRAVYGVKFTAERYDEDAGEVIRFNATVHSVGRVFGLTESDSYPIVGYVDSNAGRCNISDVKPYLRLVRNLSEWEKAEYAALCGNGGYDYDAGNCFKLIDWCNAHYVDYRGLIQMGEAKEAPEGMYRDALSRLYDADCYPEPDGIFPPMEKGPYEGEELLFRSGCGSLS